MTEDNGNKALTEKGAIEQDNSPKNINLNSDADLLLLHLEAMIQLVPFAGGVLSTYFGEVRSTRMRQRLEKLFEFFSERISELDHTQIDHDYLQGEEFAELIVQVSDQATKTTNELKIRRFANMLANQSILGADFRQRTGGIITLIERISDLDSLVLLSYGDPRDPTFECDSKRESYALVEQLSEYLNLETPIQDEVYESIVYMDNLGLTWVKEVGTGADGDQRTGPGLEECSSWRTSLGDEVVKAITPSGFFIPKAERAPESVWPSDFVSPKFQSKAP